MIDRRMMDTLLSDCVEWAGAKSKDGYGQKRMNGKVQYVHRLAFEERHGRKPVGVVRHACDNRLCYNADHLIEGTRADNSRDMVDRGRSLKGERQPNSRLTEAQVLAIKEACANRTDTYRKIGEMFGVSDTTVRQIRDGKRWTHV